MAEVTPEWVKDSAPGAAFSYTNGDSTSYWVKVSDEEWQGSRALGQPKIATFSTEQLLASITETQGQEVTLKVEREPDPEPEQAEEVPDLDEPEPEAPEADDVPDLDEVEAPAPTTAVSAKRLRNLRALIVSRNESGDGPGAAELTERFRRDYASFSQGKTQAEVDAELIVS